MRFFLGELIVVSLVLGVVGCSSDDPEDEPGVTLEGSTGCEKLDSLSEKLGCTTRCADLSAFSAECDTKLADWMDCIAQDLTQCLCESDGDLNCEGSHKADEGPALCQAEFVPVDACFP